MRKRYEIQQQLGTLPIGEISISTKSRDEFPFILRGLQHIFLNEGLRESVLSIVEEVVCQGKRATGRPGLDLWEVFVLAVVRLGLDLNYDRLEDLANNHRSFRGILGVDQQAGFGPAKHYALQTLKDNIALLDAEVLNRINVLVVQAGHQLVKKKDSARGGRTDQGLRVKVDGFVLETNVHFPTDVKLLWDSARKALDMIEKACEEAGEELAGWRKRMDWYRRMKNQERHLSRILAKGGRNRQVRVESATEAYLTMAERLNQKLIDAQVLLAPYPSVKMRAIEQLLTHYQQLLAKHVDLVRRRLLEGEKIAHSDKLFSIFEPHTQWIQKGKSYPKVELGLNLVIATDQNHFILHHQLLEEEHEVEVAVPFAKKICQQYRQDKLQSISFDKNFYSGPNYQNLSSYAHQVILPKKGKRNEEESQREAQSSFVHLRHQHSAVEANINQLEHHGLNKCPDKGIKAMKRYAALGVLAYNLHRVGKILIEQQRKQDQKKRSAQPEVKAA
jgi:IS5 family transposase